jgi:hypothetical protein
MLAPDTDPIRADLPSSTNRRIDQGFLASAKGRALGDGDELLGLDRQQR